jgi:tRNA C32,U32 (ribose-2'-O)-methylase TrmJ
LLGACTGCVSHHDPLVVMRRLYERALLAEEEAKTLRGAG